MFLGLPGATAIINLLPAKFFGVSTRLASTSFCLFFLSADAKTSAGAPFWICCTSACEPAKLYVSFRFGSFVASAVFRSPNAFVSDAAPKTVRSPRSSDVAVVGGDEDEDDFELLPHALATSASVTT